MKAARRCRRVERITDTDSVSGVAGLPLQTLWEGIATVRRRDTG